MEQWTMWRTSPMPGRPLRVLIEANDLAHATLEVRRPGGIEVRVCSGPEHEHESCPLVADGSCPLGDCDVVVSALDGPWSGPIRAAWGLRDTVVATPSVDPARSAEEGFESCLGAGLAALYRARFLAGQEADHFGPIAPA